MTSKAIAALLAGAFCLIGQAAAAQTWIAAAQSNTDRYDLDVQHVTRTGDVADSWIRRTPARPGRDEKTGKTYVVEITRRYDDCAARRFAFAEFTRKDSRGEVASSGDVQSGWREVQPGSVAEAGWKLACAVSKPAEAKALIDDLSAGGWLSAGPSADGTYSLSIKMDALYPLQKGVVGVITRADYKPGSWVDGFATTSVVSAVAVDCERRESAAVGADLYVAPHLRVQAWRAPQDKVAFEAIPPGSFLFRHLTEVCAGAGKGPPSHQDAEAGSLATGTAWGVDKGYLVTASHVIAGGKRIAVYDGDVPIGFATVVADDPANDVAVLKLKRAHPGKLAILQIATRPPTLGRRVITLGYPEPDNLGQRIKVTSGEISSTAGYQDDPRYLQVSIPFQPGNSGGPVIAPDGTVVGVAQSKLIRFDKGEGADDPPPEMVNYAVKTSYIRPLIDDLPDLGDYVVVHPTPGSDDLVAQARRAVFMLLVEH